MKEFFEKIRADKHEKELVEKAGPAGALFPPFDPRFDVCLNCTLKGKKYGQGECTCKEYF